MIGVRLFGFRSKEVLDVVYKKLALWKMILKDAIIVLLMTNLLIHVHYGRHVLYKIVHLQFCPVYQVLGFTRLCGYQNDEFPTEILSIREF